MMDRGNRFDDSYGGNFSNEDRRGFALPDRQMYSNDMGGNGGGGMFDRGQMDDRRNNGGGGSGMRNQFERRSMSGGGGGGGMDNGMNDMMFSRRGM